MEILTVQEAAKYLKVNERTIINLINRGVIQAAKLGKIWRIRQEELDALFSGIEDVNFPSEEQRKKDAESRERRDLERRIVGLMQDLSQEQLTEFYSDLLKRKDE